MIIQYKPTIIKYQTQTVYREPICPRGNLLYFRPYPINNTIYLSYRERLFLAKLLLSAEIVPVCSFCVSAKIAETLS